MHGILICNRLIKYPYDKYMFAFTYMHGVTLLASYVEAGVKVHGSKVTCIYMHGVII